ncbi:hypothetical protein B6N25_05350 [Sphingobacteriales bacterium TSM_CSS]|nr:hypothetical protein B6N25_05350 [Sphingobacteriales bacterium TSM_CSS]
MVIVLALFGTLFLRAGFQQVICGTATEKQQLRQTNIFRQNFLLGTIFIAKKLRLITIGKVFGRGR